MEWIIWFALYLAVGAALAGVIDRKANGRFDGTSAVVVLIWPTLPLFAIVILVYGVVSGDFAEWRRR